MGVTAISGPSESGRPWDRWAQTFTSMAGYHSTTCICLVCFLAIQLTEEAFRQALDVRTSLAKGYIHLDCKLSEELSTLRTDLHDRPKYGNFRVSAQPRDRRVGFHRPRPCEMRDAQFVRQDARLQAPDA